MMLGMRSANKGPIMSPVLPRALCRDARNYVLRGRLTPVLFPVLLLVVSTGCQQRSAPAADVPAPARNAPAEPTNYAAERLNLRLDRVRTTAQVLADSERSRPGKLAYAANYAAVTIPKQNVEHLQRNGQEAGRLIQREFQRFEERQPLYWEKALQILYGKPQDIESNAITLFF